MTRMASCGSMKHRGMRRKVRTGSDGKPGAGSTATQGEPARWEDPPVRAELWGADHNQLESVASTTAGPRAALAITRGRYPKAYRYVDDNEDAVAAVTGANGSTLLV